MESQYSPILFIGERAQGFSIEEICARRGLSRDVLRSWEAEYASEVKHAREVLLDRLLAHIFEDLKKQIALLDTCIEDIAKKSQGTWFNPAHAERAYSSIAQLMNTRSKMIGTVTSLLLGQGKRASCNATPSKTPINTGVNDGIL